MCFSPGERLSKAVNCVSSIPSCNIHERKPGPPWRLSCVFWCCQSFFSLWPHFPTLFSVAWLRRKIGRFPFWYLCELRGKNDFKKLGWWVIENLESLWFLWRKIELIYFSSVSLRHWNLTSNSSFLMWLLSTWDIQVEWPDHAWSSLSYHCLISNFKERTRSLEECAKFVCQLGSLCYRKYPLSYNVV